MYRDEWKAQTLSEHLRELNERDRGDRVAAKQNSRTSASTQGESRAGQTLREVLEEADRRRNANHVTEAADVQRGRANAVQIAPQTSESVGRRAKDGMRANRARSPWHYRQKTKITGVDHMNRPGTATGIAQMQGRADANDAGHILLQSREYRQRTEITGVDPLDAPIGCIRTNEGSDSSNSAPTVQDRGESMFYRALGSAERATVFDRPSVGDKLNELGTNLGSRTSADLDESPQSEHEEARIKSGQLRRKRRLADDPPGSNGSDHLARKRARLIEGNDRLSDDASGKIQLAATMQALEEIFEEKKRQSAGRLWCDPVPHMRKVSTVCEFYKAFHETTTLPLQTCVVCYRKFPSAQLQEFEDIQSKLADLYGQYGSQPGCSRCFAPGTHILACAECARNVERGVLSPAGHVHTWLRCEHLYPDELKGLSPIEEKLIALNSCYGFITKYSVVKGHRESATYPKHVKGHITIFANNVQELVTRVLPHPLLKVMDEIHVSWQGAQKPAPKDLSVLLSVRRRAIERALVWLKRNNPHYGDIEIDTAEMATWGAPIDGVPPEVYERLERDEPSASEKICTAQLVPPTERGLEAEDSRDLKEILATLEDGQTVGIGDATLANDTVRISDVEAKATSGEQDETIHEINASGMFALDEAPDVDDTEKLQYLYSALGRDAKPVDSGRCSWSRSMYEPYIVVSRGDTFADSKDVWFFAKAFPTLFPFGGGGPRQIEENMSRRTEESSLIEEAVAERVVSSRNLSMETWARVVLQRHGGRFATHRVFAFLVFNMLVRFRNHQVSMMSVTRKDFPEVERIMQSLSVERLEKARDELQAEGRTTDVAVKQLLRSLSLYGYRQPMSRELRLGMRRKIKSLIVRDGIPAIWFTLNPNDITNPVKLRLAAYRIKEPEEAEAFLTSLDVSYKRARLAVSDPLSSALFFHREMSMFFKYYVRVGEPSVFGRIAQYFGAVETNERGALHLHGLLWIHGNMGLSSLPAEIEDSDGYAYQNQITRYVDSVFTEDLDQEAFYALQTERSVTSDISSMVSELEQMSTAFEEEANFCAGATQIHTHSPTCVKYSINKPARSRHLCRFKAPWRLVERTAFKPGGILEIRRNHNMVNRWNKAIAVGLRHNHDISFIATQVRTMAIVYYVTNYATKIEDPVWKRAAAAAEVLDGSETAASEAGAENRTRRFLVKMANRIFTERALSQVEVTAHLLGLGTEFSHNKAWTYLNVSTLYWEIFRRWSHLRVTAGGADGDAVDGSVILERAGQKTTFVQAYPYRGPDLADLSLYDYMSVVVLKRKRGGANVRGGLEFDALWSSSRTLVQAIRRPSEEAVVCLDGYLSMDLDEEDGQCYRRAAVQRLAMFVPWERFLADTSGDVNDIWNRHEGLLPRRLAAIARNIQLLQRSAEDAKRDARQWAAQSGEADPMADAMDFAAGESEGEGCSRAPYKPGDIGNAIRLIDVLRSDTSVDQQTPTSYDTRLVIQQLCRFEQRALVSSRELLASKIDETRSRTLGISGGALAGGLIPEQAKVRPIKSQQASLSLERERTIQGIQLQVYDGSESQSAATYRVFSGFGEDDIEVIPPSLGDEPTKACGPTTRPRLGASTSFVMAGKHIAASFTLNRRQSISLMLICRQLDRVHSGESDVHQLCQFIGGPGGTGKSRVIEATIALFAGKGMAHRLLVTATSGTAAARINGITIHAACNLSLDSSKAISSSGSGQTGFSSSATGLRVDGQRRMDWQDRYMLIIDEISMLGARTLYAVNEQLCMLRGRMQDFGGIPIILLLGDFRQFRPVQERSILLPSSEYPWNEVKSFKIEQRRQHDRAHMIWKRFATVVMLNEQVRAAGDPQLQRLLTRVRGGSADQSDVELLNRTCYREGQQVPWESGITVVTTLNRHRWRLNVEGTLSYQRQHRAELRIFISEHKWKGGPPTEEEALMIMSYGDDSSVPVPAIFMFVPGMPVVVNKNIHTSLKLVNGSDYRALDVIIDKAYPGHRVSAAIILHFGPPAGIILAAESTSGFRFVGMPPGTILLTPLSSKIECTRRRPWQRRDVTRRGLPCTAAFACTNYKVQGRTLDRVALELRGTRTVRVNGQAVPTPCDPYSLYVQLSRSSSLQGIMLLSRARERDIVGNTVPANMVAAEKRLEELSEATVREVEAWEEALKLAHLS